MDDNAISVRQWYGGFPIRTAIAATVFRDELKACFNAAPGFRPVLFTLAFSMTLLAYTSAPVCGPAP
jgi:hypothetical protein